MAELVGIVDELRGRSVGIKMLTGEGAAIDTTRPEGRLIFGVFAAFAEFERELIRERMKAARRRGKHLGRQPLLSPVQLPDRQHIASHAGRQGGR
jgi:DNA invertase Pin-like site-specific DNA recombinase